MARVDLEAPADVWYVWVGLSLVSVGLFGFVLAVPDRPPPDAERVAAQLDRVGAGGPDARAVLTHGASELRLDYERVQLRNDAGVDRARVSIASLVPARAVEADPDQIEAVLAGRSPPESVATAILAAHPVAPTDSWQPATGTLRARAVTVEGRRLVLVG